MNHRVHRFTRVEGVRLHWAELGDPSDEPPVVFLHGLNDSYRTWRGIAPELALRRRVLLLDLPGHGLSARPDASYELQWYAQIVSGWMDVAGVRCADVVGHSYGGGVAQRMLLRCPERVRRLALVSSGGLGREISLALRLASLPLAVERLGQRFMAPCTRLALRLMGEPAGEDRVRLAAFNAQPGSARAFARTLRDVVDWRGQRRGFFQCAHELSRLPPIAIFWGDRDSVVPVSHGEALAAFAEDVSLTRFEGCGHYPHRERPAAFVSALSAFLDAPRRRASRVLLRAPAQA